MHRQNLHLGFTRWPQVWIDWTHFGIHIAKQTAGIICFCSSRYWKLHSLIDKIQDPKIAPNEGCGILEAMYNLVLSHNVGQILSTLPKLLLGTTTQEPRNELLLSPIKTIGYTTLNKKLFVVYTQPVILEGSYKTHDTINHVQEDFDHNQKNPKQFSTPHYMHDVFINIMLK